MAKLLLLVGILALAISANAIKIPLRNLGHSLREPTPFPEEALPANIELHTVEQHVDNFDPQNHDTFQQRYYINNEYYQPGGPIFLFLSGEWAITPYRMNYSLMHDMARELFGNIYYLEHRYYGQSFPTPDVSDANLRWLSTDQALADAAHFINYIKDPAVTPGAEDAPVILIGGHYSGSLVAWFRAKYPHLAIASWASSAPLLAIANHEEFKATAGEIYRRIGGNECYNAIEAGFAELQELALSGDFDEISEWFDLCDPLVTQNDISTFFAAVAELYAFIPQFGNVNAVDSVCNMIQSDAATSPGHGISLVVQFLEPEEIDCLIVNYDALIEFDRETALDADSVVIGFRQASYMTCTQFGWHHSSDSDDQPFGDQFPIELFNQACEDVFGDVFSVESSDWNIERHNTIHGGLNPDVTNVIFTQGNLDPWNTIGLQADLNDDAPFILINDGAQGSDLGPITVGDHQELLDAKVRIQYLIRLWIARHLGIDVVPI